MRSGRISGENIKPGINLQQIAAENSHSLETVVVLPVDNLKRDVYVKPYFKIYILFVLRLMNSPKENQIRRTVTENM